MTRHHEGNDGSKFDDFGPLGLVLGLAPGLVLGLAPGLVLGLAHGLAHGLAWQASSLPALPQALQCRRIRIIRHGLGAAGAHTAQL
jgi:hypothetical protein